MLGQVRSAVSKSAARSATAQCERSLATLVSMNENVPGLPATTFVAPASGKAQLSVLKNGIKVATVDNNGGASTVSFRVNAGSRFEQVAGTANFLSHLAYKRTQKRSSAKVAYDLETIGAKFDSKACREGVLYTGTALRDNLGEVVETLAECISQPMLRGWEVSEEKGVFAHKLHALANCSETQAEEELFGAAFGRASALGHAAIPSEYALSKINEEVLRAHLGQFYTAGSIVVSGVNVDHGKLVELVDAYVSGIPTAAAPAAPVSAYEGGYSEQRKDGESVTLAVGFPTAGLSNKAPSAQILATLLGFGRDLYAQNLVNAALKKPENAFVCSLKANYKAYSDVGLLWLTGSTSAKSADKLLALIAELTKTAAGASDDLITKANTKAQIAYAAAAATGQCGSAYLAKQAAAGGAVDTEAVLGAFRGVSADDVKKVAKDAFSKPVSIAAVGNTTFVPSYAKASKLFQ